MQSFHKAKWKNYFFAQGKHKALCDTTVNNFKQIYLDYRSQLPDRTHFGTIPGRGA